MTRQQRQADRGRGRLGDHVVDDLTRHADRLAARLERERLEQQRALEQQQAADDLERARRARRPPRSS